jgi:phage terminase large subunit-like protein
MTRAEAIKEWAAFYKQSPQKYNMNALLAVLENGGESMLAAVLNELGLESSLELVKDARGKR